MASMSLVQTYRVVEGEQSRVQEELVLVWMKMPAEASSNRFLQ